MRTASLRGPVSGLIPGALFALGLFTVFVDLPSREILFGPRLPLTAPSDTRPEVYSKADGQLAVLSQEDHTVKALHSFNSGVTFAPEILVAGGPGGIPVEGYTSASSPEGTIHVVVAIADPLGQVGLQALRSADMGRTWTAPVDILRHGDTLHDIDSNPFVTLRIEAGAGGRVAIFFAKQINGFFYVVSSTDGGASWGAPVRVDGGATDPTAGGYPYPDLVIAADGTIHVAYTDNRVSGSSTYGSALMYTRSTDGGVTFEPERMLATRGTFPDMTIAADGSILLASTRGARLAVHRSTDGGLTFVEFLTESVTSASFRAPRLEASARTPT
jgi:hypothetical protein